MPMETATNGTPASYDALIVGAGFAGLYQLHLLRDRLGLKTRVLEAADGVGGTWYWNRYPGARCDSESHSYRYFFSRELHDSWDYSERYPGQEEIRAYLNHVADHLDLRRDIQLETRVAAASFDEKTNLWTVTTKAGERLTCRWLITAVGCLSSANVPDIPGLETFKGEWRHTGRWPHEGVDFAGKRVGQVGTGSTGIQAAPVIAETAKTLTVFQRTANYSVPARNHPLSPERKQELTERFEEIRDLVRSTPNAHPFRISADKAADQDAETLAERYEKAWEIGGLRFRAVFGDLLVDKGANDTAATFLKGKIREIVKDPATAAILSNIDHPYAAKRPPIDTNYFDTFNKPHVSVVDVRADPIRRIVPEGIELESGKVHELDVIVFATGFDAMTGPLLAIDFEGVGGRRLQDDWAAGPRTWMGVAVPGYPNLFTVTGPGSPSVLANMIVPIEQHVEWIADCIETMRAEGVERIEAEPAAAESWMGHVNDAANATLLPEAGHSWYLGANVPGKPRVFMPYAGGMVRFREICDAVAAAGYAGFARNRPADPEAAPPEVLTAMVGGAGTGAGRAEALAQGI
ncbi:MAG: cyclohexanone monooxygenase [Rhodobacteraceae bacterium]|nr:cyclohexanone monooxygenase [Paracoccaceae bacterium]